MMYGQRREQKPGTILAGRYRLDARIGAGGFAITYKGVNLDNGVAVAVKEFCPLDGSAETEREKHRFLREAGILREFDYLQGIVSVRDVFEEGSTAYLVMDYIEGITLKDYVREYGVFSWEDLVRLLKPVMRSLTKIHRREVTHCDISPDNLILGMDNQLWLIDFGATQCADAGKERTVIVKQGYAPLEQYYSDGSVFDGKIGSWTDVYALAATMYMALTGDKPRASVERLKDGRTSDEEERRVLRNVLEDWQIEALMKGMAVHKSERYSTMDEFLEAVSYAPVYTYTRVSDREKIERKLQRSIRGLLALLLLMVLVLCGFAAYIFLGGDALGSGRQTSKERQAAGEDSGQTVQQSEETDLRENGGQRAEGSQTEQETSGGDADSSEEGSAGRETRNEAGRTDAGKESGKGSVSTDAERESGNGSVSAGTEGENEAGSTDTGQKTGGSKAAQQTTASPASSGAVQESGSGTVQTTAPQTEKQTDSAQPAPQTDSGQTAPQTDSTQSAQESGDSDGWQDSDDDDDDDLY